MRLRVPRRLFCVGVLAMSCTPGYAGEPASPQGAWVAVEISGTAAAPGVESTLQIGADGSVTGTGGCNRYRGRAETAGGTLSFSPLAATRMACPGETMAQEGRLFTALAATRGYRLEQGRLVLLGEGGTVLARFSRMG